jgi:hypothetical protein
MSRFIQVDYPKTHAGVARFERGFRAIGQSLRSFDGARGAATLLLAAMVSALLVVANEVVETWTEGHLLAAWVALWAVGFAALALFAQPMRHVAARARHGLKAWAAARKEAAEAEKLWQVALTDARVMADLSRAMSADATRDLRNYY